MRVGVIMAFQYTASQYIGTLKLRFSGNSTLMETIKTSLPTTLPPYFEIKDTSGRFHFMSVDELEPTKGNLIIKIEGPGQNLEGFARAVVNDYGLDYVKSALLSIDATVEILNYSIEVEDRGKTDPAYVNLANKGGIGYGDGSYLEQDIERSASPNYMNTGVSNGFFQGQDGKKHHILEASHSDQEISNLLGYRYVRPENQ